MNLLHRLSWLFLLVFLAACGQTAASPAAPATIVPTEGVMQTVSMGQPWRYQHSSGLFAIDVPRGWSATDTSTASELIVRFTDDNTNAVMLTNVLTVTNQLDSSSLNDLLRAHLVASYGDEPTFAQQPPRTQQDGSQLIVWGYNAASPDGSQTRLLGNSFIEQHGGLISLLTLVLPSDQYARLRPQIDATLNSYKVRGETSGAPSVDELGDVEIRALEPYTYPGELFRIDVPVGWTVETPQLEGRAMAIWNDPSHNGWIMVQVLPDDSQRSPEELGGLLKELIGEALGGETGFAIDESETQADNVAKILWRYQATADNKLQTQMAGSSIGLQRGEKIGLVSASLPSSQLAVLQPQLDAIFASFTLNETAPNP